MSQIQTTVSDALIPVVNELQSSFENVVIDAYSSSGDVFILIQRESLLKVAAELKEVHHFVYLTDVFGIDNYTSKDRFEVVYNLVDLKNGRRVFLKVRCPEENPVVDSVTSVWPNADWAEREVFDMFGIRFNNHPDLRRIYMPEDFAYYPLRKEFPLLGIPGSIDLPATTPDPDRS